jgi:hypothetical protein
MQRIEIEIISAKTGEAPVAGASDALAGHVVGYFRNQIDAVALIGNYAADQFLGPAVAVVVGGVDQCHAKRTARAQRFFFFGRRMSPLREMPRTLPERRNNGAVRKPYRMAPFA